ncbi:MAG: hypothetical protein ACQERZ_08945, partial [Fusobacteriota bacterium]
SWLDTNNDEGLEERKEYQYKVVAYDELENNGDDKISDIVEINDITAPSEVTGVNLDLISDFRIRVSWDEVKNEDLRNYEIQVTTEGNEDNFITVSTPLSIYNEVDIYDEDSADSFNPGDTVLVRVRAVDGSDNNSVWSDIEVIDIDYTKKIGAVDISSLTSGTDLITLEWSKPDVNISDDLGIEKYMMELASDFGFSNILETSYSSDNGTSDNIDMSDRLPGTYYVRITPIGENGEIGEISSRERVKYFNADAPIIGSKSDEQIEYDMMLAENESGDEIKGVEIRWDNKGTEVNEYVVYMKSSSEGDYTEIGRTTNTTDDKISYFYPLSDGAEHWFKVSCVTDSGEGKASGEIHIIDDGSPTEISSDLISVSAKNEYVTTPTGIGVNGDDTDLIVSWGGYAPPRDFSYYKVYISKLKLFDGDGNRLVDNSPGYDRIENSNGPFKLVKTTVANVDVNIDPTSAFPHEYDGEAESVITGRYVIKVTCVDQLGNESKHSRLVYAWNKVPTIQENVSSVDLNDDGEPVVTLPPLKAGTWEIFKDDGAGNYYSIGEGTGEFTDDKGIGSDKYKIKYIDQMGNKGEISDNGKSAS